MTATADRDTLILMRLDQRLRAAAQHLTPLRLQCSEQLGECRLNGREQPVGIVGMLQQTRDKGLRRALVMLQIAMADFE